MYTAKQILEDLEHLTKPADGSTGKTPPDLRTTSLIQAYTLITLLHNSELMLAELQAMRIELGNLGEGP